MTSQLPRLLINQLIPEQFLKQLSQKFTIDYHHQPPLNRQELLTTIKDNCPNAILFTGSSMVIDKELLEHTNSNLKALSTISVGYNHIDINECEKRNIPVGYTPGQ
ncbi:unnamed protein product [Didymodactylos carnosus]|uniref:D-isomer specific 2-hydroxyacid dehydrogenase catalytic domain-containing protein n=1 Tax=Didymodactylos carnosus TaxID=1234261 RepID=A0A814ZM42_9BILA|nr:unnamed protein product [Didymodactylos carnosus]CAF1245299.1 unnamed protein product [Didymodactylos carnosus]CAF3856348.1 unnamed protein product [Didymodactylos carnosus]CAF4011086.1 unnamed protein product [Didymodactylos carnosus]